MKKQVLIVAMLALLAGMTSCHKEDLDYIRKPYRVAGEIDPGLCLPLIGSGSMNFNDILSKLDGNFANIILDDTLITFHYDTTINTTLDIGGMMDSKHAKHYKYTPRSKDTQDTAAYISVDTVISYPLNIDLFDNVQIEDLLGDDNIAIEHLWLNLKAYVKGECSENLQDKLRENTTISINQLHLSYIDHHGNGPLDFDGNASLTDSLFIDDIVAGDSVVFPNVNLASIINALPKQVVATFHMHINVKEAFLFSIMDEAVAQGQFDFSQMLDSLDFTSLFFSINCSLDFPFEVKIKDLSYDYTVPINSSAVSGSEEMDLSEMIDKVKKTLKERGLTLDMDTLNNLVFEFDNGIPMNIKLNAEFIPKNGGQSTPLFSNGIIASAITTPIPGSNVREASSPKTSLVKLPLTLDVLDAITNASGVNLSLGLSTDGTTSMAIKRTDFLNVRMKLQLHPSLTIDMPLFGGK